MNKRPKITKVTITYYSDWGEYHCKAYITVDGKHVRYPDADYYTDDKEDAEDTKIEILNPCK